MSHREAAFEAGGVGGQQLMPAHAQRGTADRAEAVINRLPNTEAAVCLTADLPENLSISGESQRITSAFQNLPERQRGLVGTVSSAAGTGLKRRWNGGSAAPAGPAGVAVGPCPQPGARDNGHGHRVAPSLRASAAPVPTMCESKRSRAPSAPPGPCPLYVRRPPSPAHAWPTDSCHGTPGSRPPSIPQTGCFRS